jgi:hypothetical protein
MALDKAYNFTLVGQPEISITMFPTRVDLTAALKAHLSGKSMKAAEQVIRKRLMNRLQKDGAEGARLVPIE